MANNLELFVFVSAMRGPAQPFATKKVSGVNSMLELGLRTMIRFQVAYHNHHTHIPFEGGEQAQSIT